MVTEQRACVYSYYSVDGNQYIGSTKSWPRRKSVHMHHLRNKTHSNPRLQEAFDKWGEWGKTRMEWKVLLWCDPGMEIFWEQKCIDKFKPEYNIQERAGYGAPKGRKHSEETKQKISESVRASRSQALSGLGEAAGGENGGSRY